MAAGSSGRCCTHSDYAAMARAWPAWRAVEIRRGSAGRLSWALANALALIDVVTLADGGSSDPGYGLRAGLSRR